MNTPRLPLRLLRPLLPLLPLVTVALAVPAGAATAGTAPTGTACAPDRSRQPVAAPEAPWAPPTPQRFDVLGLEASLVERHDLPIVTLMFAWDVGSANDPAGKAGMHGLCIDLLDEATASLDQSALEDKKADLGATVVASPGREASVLSARVARERLPETLDLVAQLLLEPAISPQDLERLRAQDKAAVLQQRGNADSVARRVLGPTVYGANHPFGHVITEASLDAVTREDCVRVARSLKPRGARLLVVGDITRGDLTALLESKLGAWKGAAPKPLRVAAARAPRGTVVFVDVPGAAQSRILVTHEGPARTDPDHHAITLMSQVLGSGLPSRLVQNLRERNGFTYGARAEFDYARSGSLFAASTSVRTDATGPALREIFAELRGMTERPVLETEVEREREGGLRAFPNRFGNGGNTLAALGELSFHRLPLDTWQKMPAELAAVRTDDVQRAVKQHLRTEPLVVVAGDREQVWPALEQLVADKVFGATRLSEVDADGRPVARAGTKASR